MIALGQIGIPYNSGERNESNIVISKSPILRGRNIFAFTVHKNFILKGGTRGITNDLIALTSIGECHT